MMVFVKFSVHHHCQHYQYMFSYNSQQLLLLLVVVLFWLVNQAWVMVFSSQAAASKAALVSQLFWNQSKEEEHFHYTELRFHSITFINSAYQQRETYIKGCDCVPGTHSANSVPRIWEFDTCSARFVSTVLSHLMSARVCARFSRCPWC